jgi:transketolase
MIIAELQRFRQLGSRTPGHPEYRHAPGVEATTGPLGQGLALPAGMALAERMLNAEFGPLVDYHTYVLASDGDLMEGISQDAIIGEAGIFIGMTRFGASAPYKDVYNYFNITPEACDAALQQLTRAKITNMPCGTARPRPIPPRRRRSNGDSSRYQRIWPHRPQYPARDCRIEAQGY